MRLETSRLLAVDPGGTTGVALFHDPWEGGGTVTAELDFFHACSWITSVLDQGDVTVAIERFTISERTIKLGRDHTAIELTGVLRWLLHERGLPELLFASPADAKRLVTDDRLRALGVWHRGGGGHANDAARHGVLWLVKAGALRLPA